MPTEYSPSKAIQVEEAPMRFSTGEVIMAKDVAHSGEETPTKRIAYTLGTGGDLRTKLTLISGAEGIAVKGQIYKNGSPVGTQRETTSEAGESFIEDISGWETGDSFEVWLWLTAGAEDCEGKIEIKVATFPFVRELEI